MPSGAGKADTALNCAGNEDSAPNVLMSSWEVQGKEHPNNRRRCNNHSDEALQSIEMDAQQEQSKPFRVNPGMFPCLICKAISKGAKCDVTSTGQCVVFS